MTEQKSAGGVIRRAYEALVNAHYPEEAGSWPILTGADLLLGGYQGWLIIFLKHSGNAMFSTESGIGEMTVNQIGFPVISRDNLEVVRDRMYHHFRAKVDDAVIMVPPDGNVPESELKTMLSRHEQAMGLSKMKIFLSHKSSDKGMVREFRDILADLGFEPWLDEESMAAGAQLDRAILKGMEESCAAVFFITPNFADDAFLATEINYAISEYRNRPKQFSIIALVMEENGRTPAVPGLLKPFVWKKPETRLQALREIIRSLPIAVGKPVWR